MSDNGHRQGYLALLWIAGGILLILPSLLGDGRSGLVPVGIAFIVIGVASAAATAKDSPE